MPGAVASATDTASRARVLASRAIGEAAADRREACLALCYQALEAAHKFLVERVWAELPTLDHDQLVAELRKKERFSNVDVATALQQLRRYSLDDLAEFFGTRFESTLHGRLPLRAIALTLFPASGGATNSFDPKTFALVQSCRNRNAGHDNPDPRDPGLPARTRPTEMSDCVKIVTAFFAQARLITPDEQTLCLEYRPFVTSSEEPDLADFVNPLAALPPSTYSQFVGAERANTVAAVAEALLEWPIVSVIGTGGMGKSVVAREAAIRALSSSARFDSVVWISCKKTEFGPLGEAPLPADAARVEDVLAAVVGGDSQDFDLPASDMGTAVTNCLAPYKKRRSLIVLDSLEDLEDVRLEDFVTELAKHARILVTSRERLLRSASFPLDGMEPPELRQIFVNEARATRLSAGPLEMDELARSVADRSFGIPLVTRAMLWELEAGKTLEQVLPAATALPPDGVAKYCFAKIVESLDEPTRLTLFTFVDLGGRVDPLTISLLTGDPIDRIAVVLQALEDRCLVRRPKLGTTRSEISLAIDNSVIAYVQSRLRHEPKAKERIRAALEETIRQRGQEERLATGEMSPGDSLARTLFLPGSPPPAESVILAYQSKYPRDPYVYYHWANYLQRIEGDLSRSAAILDEGLQSFPNNYFLRKRRGIVAKRAGRMDLAVTHLRAARTHANGRFFHCVPLGQVLSATAHFEEALAEFETVLEHPDANYQNKQFALAGAAETIWRMIDKKRAGPQAGVWELANILEFLLNQGPMFPNPFVLRWAVPVYVEGGLALCADGKPVMGHAMLRDAVSLAAPVDMPELATVKGRAELHTKQCRRETASRAAR